MRGEWPRSPPVARRLAPLSCAALLACGRLGFDVADSGLPDGQPNGDGGGLDDAAAASRFDLDAGINNTCYVRDEMPLCWGWNAYGQIGDGTMATRRLPTPVNDLAGVTAIDNASRFTCAIHAGGKVACWGDATSGRLGNDTTVGNFPEPVEAIGLDDAVQLSANNNHICALRAGGAIACWGLNSSGQIGDGSMTNRTTPFTVPGLPAIRTVATGENHTCAADVDGSLWCWGENDDGGFGSGTSMMGSPVPLAIAGVTDVVEIAAGGSYTCVRHGDGTVSCFGRNAAGQLGVTASTREETPVSPALTGVVALAAGLDHTCALASTGEVLCFGDNGDGELGNGALGGANAQPTVVGGLPGPAVEISAGWDHTCARLDSDEVWCWGKNDNGELGDDTFVARGTPAAVLLP